MVPYLVHKTPTLDPTVILHFGRIQFNIILTPSSTFSQVVSIPEDIQTFFFFLHFANHVLHAFYVLSTSYSNSFNHPNSIERRTQITIVMIRSAFVLRQLSVSHLQIFSLRHPASTLLHLPSLTPVVTFCNNYVL